MFVPEETYSVSGLTGYPIWFLLYIDTVFSIVLKHTLSEEIVGIAALS